MRIILFAAVLSCCGNDEADFSVEKKKEEEEFQPPLTENVCNVIHGRSAGAAENVWSLQLSSFKVK